MEYREAYNMGKAVLSAASVPDADTDARLLLEFVCGTNRNTLLAHGDREVTKDQESTYRDLVEKRSQRVPLQYLTGVQDFMGLEFAVNEHVLIPRQDTEILVEEALQYLHDGMQVLDMCTGSGCILLSLLNYSNNCEGVGADVSEEALKVAEKNAVKLLGEQAVRNRPGNSDETTAPEKSGESEELPDLCVGTHVSFVQSDLFEKVQGQFDMIVSNPPYIESGVIDTLMPEVRDYEPRLALDGSEDGLIFYRRILKECPVYLKKGGMLFFEIGYDQGEAVSRLMEQAGFLQVMLISDYAGMDRVVCGTLGFGDVP
ncbi:MAG: peptide chain release factor N(5)-glutamine methyltransferase [Butyrivibrio sp.]|nr:peptide chain release factor N(5)-glutamine methyltransferase [Acetatifactor muris]MCM1560423.1 peptide chain release factor N(5)-glutamine methyltransferase [Butyrivibrio sp.]